MSMPFFGENAKRAYPERKLQGPRPQPLKVGKDSYKIKKQLVANRPPIVVTYLLSPEIIHTKPQDFMNLVQQLTGKPSSVAPSTTALLLPSSSSSSYSHRCGSASAMVDSYKACEIASSTGDFNKGQENKNVKEDCRLLAHEVPSSMISNPSSVSPSLYLPSPNSYNNWLDFGHIY